MNLHGIVRVDRLVATAQDCVASGEPERAREILRHAESVIGDFLFGLTGDLLIEEHILGVLEHVADALARARRTPASRALDEVATLLAPIVAFAGEDASEIRDAVLAPTYRAA